MEPISRREFVKGLSVGAVGGYLATTALGSTVFKKPLITKKTLDKVDIGTIRGLKVTCISETSWFDNMVQMGDFKKAGGALVSQYDVMFSREGVAAGYKGSNAGGYSALVDIELLDGSHKKILLDTGWNNEWMTKRFEEEGIDRMLKDKEIEFLFVSHDHYDHYWGIQSTLQYNPEITVMIPNNFMPQSYELLAGSSFPKPPISNSVPHRGKLIKHDFGKIYQLFPGVITTAFNCPCGRGVRGEQVLIFNIEGKGVATVTGCCHMGIITLLEYIQSNVKGSEKIYGVYGGLHVSPYDDWDPFNDDLVRSLPKYKIQKLGCNHCTGYITTEKMIATGVPVVTGTASNKTKRDIYLGNGDTFEL